MPILPVISDPLPHARLFDRYIAIDWSAHNRPKFGRDSIWVAVASTASETIETVNIGTRRQVEGWLLQQLAAAVHRRERVLVGFDFPYGYPAGFASALGVTDTSCKGVWSYLASHDASLSLPNWRRAMDAIERRIYRSSLTISLALGEATGLIGGVAGWAVSRRVRRGRARTRPGWARPQPGEDG